MTAVPPRRLSGAGDRYGDCVWIKNAFMRGLTELVQSNISWKLHRVNDQLDVEVDWVGGMSYRVGIRCGQKLIASCVYQEGGQVEVNSLLSKNLIIVCAVHQADIERWCPGAVAGVEATREQDGPIRLVVKFKNGHWLEVAERDADKDEFKAHCLMLYDLPPL